MYRFHLLGLVHLPVSERYMGCAFTQKIVKMSKMLLSLGHEVYIYGAEGSDAPCTEFIQTHTLKEIRDEWGEGDNRFEIGYDWKTKGFKHDFNTERTPVWYVYNRVATQEIEKRKKDDDFLLVMQGQYQKPVADAVDLFLTCEPGIGYRGSFSKLVSGKNTYRAFESAYLQNFTYGSENPFQSINGNYYDRVIPNYFEAKDFPFREEKDDFFFFIGRMIFRKGVLTAVETCKHLGAKLILAGQDKEVDWDYPDAKYIGYVDPEERAYYMSHAKAVFVPTLYLEAFGGVNVEAQLCGTPVITTNFSVFPETVQQGITGYRCDTLQDFVNAGKDIENLDTKEIRRRAERYLTDNVRFEFEKWFDDLYQLYLSATNDGVKGWSFVSVE
jgi:glycosyltransferase involved in cell wall biosynthesis